MANVGDPHNSQPDLQAFRNATNRAGNDTPIKVDRNTGEVGTTSLLGRAWRAVVPCNAGRSERDRNAIETFKSALLSETNYDHDMVNGVLDKCLPNRQDGRVSLTAGVVRNSIKHLESDAIKEFIKPNPSSAAKALQSPFISKLLGDYLNRSKNGEIWNFYTETTKILEMRDQVAKQESFERLRDKYIGRPRPEDSREGPVGFGGDDAGGSLVSASDALNLSDEFKAEFYAEDLDIGTILDKARKHVIGMIDVQPFQNFKAELRERLTAAD